MQHIAKDMGTPDYNIAMWVFSIPLKTHNCPECLSMFSD